MKTVESFTLPEDRNIFSRVMEMHQRHEGANGKIMNYLSQTYPYPTGFSTLLYASQLLQAEAIMYGVEHWRRHRGRCMGAIYWQLNDIWPVASWASIDYFGRWKALHYYAKRFFAPVLLSCEETGETTSRVSVVTEPSEIFCTAKLCVSNETKNAAFAKIRWRLCDNNSNVLQQGETEADVPAITSVWLETLDVTGTDFLTNHLFYELFIGGGRVSSGSVLFTAPKHYRFVNPGLNASIDDGKITVTSVAYAKSVEIAADCDMILSDNYFDMEKGTMTVEILEGSPKEITLRSVFEIR
jgi:beta-mannosidase